jgi:hypothetical protein
MLMPEKLVAVFTPNRQSVDGAVELAARAVEYRRNSDDPRPLSIFPLPSRIVTDEHKLLQVATDRYRTRFEECLRVSYELKECSLGSYFQEVAIPHKGFYGFHEMVAVRDDPSASDALSINRAYERFFLRLVTLDSAMEPMPRIAEDEPPPEPKISVRATSGSAFLKNLGFDNDIFISYAQLDDVPVGDSAEGFVSQLHKDVSIRLAQILGQSVRIWQDRKLQGEEGYSELTRAALERTALLLVVVSPGYLSSEFCLRELKTFVQAAGSLRVVGRSRVLWLANSPLPVDSLPDILRSTAGYKFYQMTDAGQRPRELSRVQYRDILEDLCYDIKRSLVLRATGKDPEQDSATVYLAETSSDVVGVRGQLLQELVARGHSVLPDRPLPWTAEELMHSVRGDLNRAQLSVHLIGSRSGIIPEGETRSIVALQYELALLQADIKRVVWAARASDASNQLGMLENSGAEGTEVLLGSIEELKSIVLDKLTHRPSAPKALNSRAPQLYLICDLADLPAAKELRDHLFANGIEATLPLFDGDVAELRRDRQEMLQACDVVLIFWGASSEVWVRQVFRELLKFRDRYKPVPFGYYLASPPNASKNSFDTRVGFVIREASTSALELLLKHIESRSSV